jgi:hypothetical protein
LDICALNKVALIDVQKLTKALHKKSIKISVAELHHFYAARALILGKINLTG